MTRYSWNKRIEDEAIWHTSAKQALDRETQAELWALANGNIRGLKKVRKMYYNTGAKKEKVTQVTVKVIDTVKKYNSGEEIIHSESKDIADTIEQGYVQGLIRAYIIIRNNISHNESPPQDLSVFRNNVLTEVNNAKT